jgi:hypothetical protein
MSPWLIFSVGIVRLRTKTTEFSFSALDFVKNWTQFVLVKFKVSKFIENHIFIDSRVSFKAMLSSLEFVLQHNILVSANKIGFDSLFIVNGKSFIYIKKSNGPSTEPWGMYVEGTVDQGYREQFFIKFCVSFRNVTFFSGIISASLDQWKRTKQKTFVIKLELLSLNSLSFFNHSASISGIFLLWDAQPGMTTWSMHTLVLEMYNCLTCILSFFSVPLSNSS